MNLSSIIIGLTVFTIVAAPRVLLGPATATAFITNNLPLNDGTHSVSGSGSIGK